MKTHVFTVKVWILAMAIPLSLLGVTKFIATKAQDSASEKSEWKVKRVGPKSMRNTALIGRIFLLLFVVITAAILLMESAHTSTLASAQAQEESGKSFALMPESWARESATRMVTPDYPAAAIQQGVSGVVHIKFETDPDGEVVRIKVKPRTNSLLAKAVASAVRQWKFKAPRDLDGIAKPVISRLIFHFRLDTEPKVRLYDPGPHPPDVQHLGYYNSAKEMREWRDWPEMSTDPSTP